jgi:diaminohydroxyphosphoribosylaminopyrimidine deaminase/5-amino-6-(5-phosphoribosylamino)uracil reductase
MSEAGASGCSEDEQGGGAGGGGAQEGVFGDEVRGALDLAARLAVRGAGLVEPNPMVGAVFVAPGGGPWVERVIACGHHRRFGGLHAEAEAIASARARGVYGRLRGSTAYVTFEPCNHHGKQPPCAGALVEAGVGRCVIARREENPVASGGAERLRAAGIEVVFSAASASAVEVSEPFVRGLTSDRPWTIAKWAQDERGRLVTGADEPRWISGVKSRLLVHRLRARCGAVITGAGTVLKDDPSLNVRGVKARRGLHRVVIDPRLEVLQAMKLGLTGGRAMLNLLSSANEGEVLVFGEKGILEREHERERESGVDARLSGLRVRALAYPVLAGSGRADLSGVLAWLRGSMGVHAALIEAGPSLLGSAFAQDVVDECHVYIGGAAKVARGGDGAVDWTLMEALAARAQIDEGGARLDAPGRWRVVHRRVVGEDVRLVYRRNWPRS